jgi:hypothetical protein
MPAPKLHPVEASAVHARRERVFLVIAGLFLGTLAMLNILGVTRFITLFTWEREGAAPIVFAVAVGVLPYPITFLCTDFISELYGRARANAVVWTGLLLNGWVMFILWLGGVLPGSASPHFFAVRTLAFGAVAASMAAYLAAQLTDVYLFHFWKGLTRGRHLWLRNNGSTMVSQIVDTVLVLLITWTVGGLEGVIDASRPAGPQVALLIATAYAFKFACAALDTIPFYVGVRWLARYLQIDPTAEHAGVEDAPAAAGGAE